MDDHSHVGDLSVFRPVPASAHYTPRGISSWSMIKSWLVGLLFGGVIVLFFTIAYAMIMGGSIVLTFVAPEVSSFPVQSSPDGRLSDQQARAEIEAIVACDAKGWVAIPRLKGGITCVQPSRVDSQKPSDARK